MTLKNKTLSSVRVGWVVKINDFNDLIYSLYKNQLSADF